jgi:hypothetical protein
LLVPLILVVAIAVTVANSRGGLGGKAPADPPTLRTTVVSRSATPLPAPVSGESVVGMRAGPLILGGLDSSSVSVSGVFQLDSGNGELREAGTLSGPLHDAAAVALGDQVLVFGGGTETSTDAVSHYRHRAAQSPRAPPRTRWASCRPPAPTSAP